MIENPIAISILNDFVFCPASIYFHNLDEEEDMLVQSSYQLNGTAAHKNSDLTTYTTRRSVLQGVWVYSQEYNLCGKVDTFDVTEGILTERKKKIKEIYDGYVFQLYAQYFALAEMGYEVNEIRLYSMDDNKVYVVEKPEINERMFEKFIALIDDIGSFQLDNFKQENISKCESCIYEPLCCFSLLKGDVVSDYRT